MLGSSLSELRRHYGFYLAIFVIALIFNVLIWWIASIFGLGEGLGNVIMMMTYYGRGLTDVPREEMLYMMTDVLQEMNLSYFVISQLFVFLLSTLVTILMNRSLLQKVNYPETQIADSAYFNTPLGDCLILPLKLFFAQIVVGILYAVILFAASLLVGTASQSFGSFTWVVAVIVSLLFMAMAVFVLPIQYFIAYDVERRYNVWATITKSMAIGRGHFLRIVKTLLVQMALMVFYFGFFSVTAIYGFESSRDVLTMIWVMFLIAMAGFIFFLLPLMNIYLIKTMNQVISLEY